MVNVLYEAFQVDQRGAETTVMLILLSCYLPSDNLPAESPKAINQWPAISPT